MAASLQNSHEQELYFIQKEISKDFPYDANYIKEQYTELFGNQTS